MNSMRRRTAGRLTGLLLGAIAMALTVSCDAVALPVEAAIPVKAPAELVPLPGDTALTQGSRIETGLCNRQTLELNLPAAASSVDYAPGPDAGVDLRLVPGAPSPSFGAITIYQPPEVPPPAPPGAQATPTATRPEDTSIEACETGFTVAISILERTSFDLATVPIPGAVIVRPGLTSNGPGYLARARVDCGTDPAWTDFGQTTGPTGNGREHFPAVAWQRTLPIPADPSGCALQVRWIRTP